VFKVTALKRTLFFLIVDVLLSIFSLYFAFLLRFNFVIPLDFGISVLYAILLLVPIKIIFLWLFGQYSITWRFYNFTDAKNLLKAHVLAYILFFIISVVSFSLFHIPKSIAFIDFYLSLVLIGSFRFFKRFLLEHTNVQYKKTIFIGANTKTQEFIKLCHTREMQYNPILIFDDVKDIPFISGIPVCGMEKLDVLENANTAIITKELPQKKLDELVVKLNNIGITDIKIYKRFEDKLKNVSIEDLLARKPKDLDTKAIEKFVNKKVILITGAGGSIGSEISKQCEKFGAKKLILVDNCEFNLYKINEDLGGVDRRLCMVDVAGGEIGKIFETEKPDIVIHAAAYKHVPLCEKNPRSAVINNIKGTKNIVDLSIECNVEEFIFISTDKAVRPTNIMGATKRVCELYIQSVDSKNTKLSAVRFGNVLGSSGSVIPKFRHLIAQNKPLSVTHPEITRYFMLISEACQLVLQAGSLAKNGEIFILDMGEPVKIVDLAKTMLRLYGKNENNIVFTGLREGEKLYEELLVNEADKETKYESILIAKANKSEVDVLNKKIQELLELYCFEDISNKLLEIIPEKIGLKSYKAIHKIQ